MAEETKRPEEKITEGGKPEDKPDNKPTRGGCCGGDKILSARRASAEAGQTLEGMDKLLEECGQNPAPPPEGSKD